MKKIRWGIVSLAITAVLVLLAIEHVRRSLAKLPELRTVPMAQRDLLLSIDTTGVVEPDELVEVGAEVAGTIVGFGQQNSDSPQAIEVGTRVAKGSILVQLDRAIYELELEIAQTALKLAIADVGRLQTQYRQAERDYHRAKQLRETNSESQYDRAVTALEMSKTELEVGQVRQEQAISSVKQAQLRFDRTTIRSPIDGVVIDRRAKLGQRVGLAGPGLVLLARDLDHMRIRASVSETDIGKVYVGQRVSFSVDAYRNKKLAGHVDKILMNARVQGNFVTYDVLISPKESTESLMPHMTADVQLETAFRKDAFLVPSDSLQWWPTHEQMFVSSDQFSPAEGASDLPMPKKGDLAKVWIPTGDGKVEALNVRVGITDGVQTEVTAENLKRKMPVVVGTIRKTTLARIIPNIKTLR